VDPVPACIAQYPVARLVASGGMGQVYLARDPDLDRPVAIKLLREGFDNADLRARFEEEARHAARLAHPNIVTIYEFGTHEGRPFIVMEFIPGHSLAEIIRDRHPVPLARRLQLGEELCAGLAHAHRARLVHRDVKPANLMVTTSGVLKVLDFGIAKLHGVDRTQEGVLVGTVNYMSPEQVQGLPVDHRSDVFSVGAVLYELFTCEQAFSGSITTAMFAIVHREPAPMVDRCPGLTPALAGIVSRCLAKHPGRRYQDLSLVKRDLERIRHELEALGDDGRSAKAAPVDIEKTAVLPVTPLPVPAEPAAEAATVLSAPAAPAAATRGPASDARRVVDGFADLARRLRARLAGARPEHQAAWGAAGLAAAVLLAWAAWPTATAPSNAATGAADRAQRAALSATEAAAPAGAVADAREGDPGPTQVEPAGKEAEGNEPTVVPFQTTSSDAASPAASTVEPAGAASDAPVAPVAAATRSSTPEVAPEATPAPGAPVTGETASQDEPAREGPGAEHALIRQLIFEYQQAYTRLDEDRLRELRPSFGGIPAEVKALASSVTLTISPESIQIADDARSASVSLTEIFRYQWQEPGHPSEERAQSVWLLSKSGAHWQITGTRR
jgi:serine/threonine-protein kinase